MNIICIYPKYYPRTYPRLLSHWHLHWVVPLSRICNVFEVNFRPKNIKQKCYSINISKQVKEILEKNNIDAIFFLYSYNPEKIIDISLLKQTKLVSFGGDDIFPGYFEKRYNKLYFSDLFIVFDDKYKNYKHNIILSNWRIDCDNFFKPVTNDIVYIASFVGSMNDYRSKMINKIKSKNIINVKKYSNIKEKLMYDIFNKSFVSVVFQDGKGCNHMKLRNLEIAVAGGCQISDNSLLLSNIFKNIYVPCINDIKELKKNINKRQDVAIEMQNYVLENFDSKKELDRILGIL